MEYALLGFFTGLSLILALGAQNIFVIEQGLKKQYVFLICFICYLSDLILIFLGIFLFYYFDKYFNQTVELIFNILLINQRHIKEGITIIVVKIKKVPQSPFSQSTRAPEDEARVVLPAVPIEASKAY